MKTLIWGDGWLGNRLSSFMEEQGRNVSLEHGWITGMDSVLGVLDREQPDVLVNCIAQTGGDKSVDWCESNRNVTVESNVLVPCYMALACAKLGVRMAHFGSGCVYNGHGYTEEDPPNFFGSLYSRTKVQSEAVLKEFEEVVLQIRLRMPLDSIPHSRNLLTKILKYSKVISVPNSITVIPSMFPVLLRLLDQGTTGLFNFVNRGNVTHGELLTMYQRLSGKTLEYELIGEEELSELTLAGRSNCTIESTKLDGEVEGGVEEAHEAAERCIREYIENES